MKIQVTPSDERTRFLLVEAIYKGFHIRKYRGGLEIISEHTAEDQEYLENRLNGTRPFPIYHLDLWAQNIVERIKQDPDSRIIQCNSFEYVDGAVPDCY
jgi:hypothetical protein